MRFPLEHAPDQLCTQKLTKGMVKRCSLRGPLLGYYVACPCCGFAALYLGEHNFVEEPTGFRFPKRLIGAEVALTCYACRRALRIVDGAFEVSDEGRASARA